MIRAPRPGDRVAVVAPAGPVEPDVLKAGTEILRGWGLRVEVGPSASAGAPAPLPHLAAPDAERARDLERAWCDPGVAAVICARGGYGSQRILDLLDWPALAAARPKPLLGFSDITALHEAFAVRLAVPTWHGPMPGTTAFTDDAVAQERLRRALFAPHEPTVITAPTARTLVPGRARGITMGGCASLLAAGAGTPHTRPSAAGGILLLEDVGEEPYRIDRVLTQLLRSGRLAGVAGIALGSWRDCGPYEEVRAVLLDRLAPLGVPMAEELAFGHGPHPHTVPLGVPATLDADRATLSCEGTPSSSGTGGS
ncbi:LD-carboxypeptidase [Streptomyces harbinensis]|uniref:S66 peptidase family protein n=1 Tax=Streptomyces harbinensis TaxID=1176198 RepID=UPI001590740E|nr:LD-carboxypeptidase [Streptomyces harbinensis]QKV71540.1 LD-carboxypeptidase [Streptomyces harbinensis]